MTIEMSCGAQQASSGVEVDRCVLSFRRNCSRLQQRSHQGNSSVTAHCAIALIMHKQHTEIGFGRHGVSDYATIHIEMPTRFPHNCPPDVIVVVQHIPPALSHSGTLQFSKATCDFY